MQAIPNGSRCPGAVENRCHRRHDRRARWRLARHHSELVRSVSLGSAARAGFASGKPGLFGGCRGEQSLRGQYPSGEQTPWGLGSRPGPGRDRFASTDRLRPAQNGCPILTETLGWLECSWEFLQWARPPHFCRQEADRCSAAPDRPPLLYYDRRWGGFCVGPSDDLAAP
jgi:hypothetical protein